MKSNFKITPEALKNESGLTQMILMGKSIRQIWVYNELALQVEEYGRIFPLDNRGMGLFISTGGYGFTSPALGLGVDSVLEIKVLQII